MTGYFIPVTHGTEEFYISDLTGENVKSISGHNQVNDGDVQHDFMLYWEPDGKAIFSLISFLTPSYSEMETIIIKKNYIIAVGLRIICCSNRDDRLQKYKVKFIKKNIWTL